MSLLDELAERLGRYDDAAWSALASRGLLRRARKDLERASPTLLDDDATAVLLSVADHTVRFDNGGVASARCDCPATAICQHVVAAGLWLAARSVSAPAEGPDAHAELMAIGSDELRRHAGLPGLRWAHQRLADLDDNEVAVVEPGPVPVVRLVLPRLTLRYVGGGIAGLTTETTIPSLARVQVLAVLVYQRANGVRIDPLEPGASRDPASYVDRQRVLATARQLLLECVALGLTHLGPTVEERFEGLASAAQGADLHRLARFLRRLADHTGLVLARSTRADEGLMLDDCALAFALVTATTGDPDARRLLGAARTEYHAVPDLELLGVGGHTWRTPAGYHGLTCLFWWPQERRFVSWTDSRPELLADFDPRLRYEQPGPWSGLASPAAATSARVLLRGARLSAAGRLSGAEATTVSVLGDGGGLLRSLETVETWTDLARRTRPTSLLDEPDPLADWVCVRPQSLDPPFFDPHRQVLVVVARDGSGEALALELPWNEHTRHAVERLEQIVGSGALRPRVVSRLDRRTGLRAMPLSVVTADGVVGLHLGADTDPEDGALEPEQPSATPDTPPTSTPLVLLDLQAVLREAAERGASASLAGDLEPRLAALRGAGLGVFTTPAGGLEPAEALLRTAYLARQVEALL